VEEGNCTLFGTGKPGQLGSNFVNPDDETGLDFNRFNSQRQLAFIRRTVNEPREEANKRVGRRRRR
jgi:hypothetical protein